MARKVEILEYTHSLTPGPNFGRPLRRPYFRLLIDGVYLVGRWYERRYAEAWVKGYEYDGNEGE